MYYAISVSNSTDSEIGFKSLFSVLYEVISEVPMATLFCVTLLYLIEVTST